MNFIRANTSKSNQLEVILNNTFKDIEDVVSMEYMTNAQLKQIINKIEVDSNGKVDIYFHIFSDMGLDQPIIIDDALSNTQCQLDRTFFSIE